MKFFDWPWSLPVGFLPGIYTDIFIIYYRHLIIYLNVIQFPAVFRSFNPYLMSFDHIFIHKYLQIQQQSSIIFICYQQQKREMKQMSRLIDSQGSNIIEWLGEQLQNSCALLEDPEHQNAIHALMEYRQNKIYYFFTNDLNSYFGAIWDHIVQGNPDFQAVILDKMGEKQNNVYEDLKQSRLNIAERAPIVPFDYDQDSKNNKIYVLRQQSDSLKKKISEINSNLEADNSESEAKDIKDIYNKLYSEQKIKEAEQFVKKNKEAQIQRRKKLEEQRKKEQEALLKKEAQIKEQEEQILKAKRQEIFKKQKQLHEKREKEKEIREQRNTEYMRIRKSLNDKPPLYQKIFQGYSKRYHDEENEKMTRMRSERKHYLEHITSKLLEKHEKDYDQIKQKKEKQRREREQISKSQAKSRTKVHSSYELQKYVDPKEIQKQQAKEKIQKMKQYRSIVKQKFKPKIDMDKRKELMNLIQEMELNHKRVKRVKLENGSIMYEELKAADPKMIGMEYLQQTKQMAAKAREKKKQQKDVIETDLSKQIKKPINYLEELRKNRPKQEKSSFVQKKNMSYDDKVKKVMLESQKLAEITKQNEMMLKFGKFKTSEQILACKEEIDQNYLDIVNMKLKLILSQQEKDEEASESQYSRR